MPTRYCAPPSPISLQVEPSPKPSVRRSVTDILAERRRRLEWERENVRTLRRPSRSDSGVQSAPKPASLPSDEEMRSDGLDGLQEDRHDLTASLWTFALCIGYWFAGWQCYIHRPGDLLWWALVGFGLIHIVRPEYLWLTLFFTAGGVGLWHYYH